MRKKNKSAALLLLRAVSVYRLLHKWHCERHKQKSLAHDTTWLLLLELGFTSGHNNTVKIHRQPAMLFSANNGTFQDEGSYSPDYPRISPDLENPKEWTYIMRRTMQEIVRGVYLGPYSAASRSKLQDLLDCGITHIVCVRQDIEANFIKPNFPDKFKYLVLDIADQATENIIQHFRKVKAFIDEALNSGGNALVHGNAGISRSAALVLAYLMETYGLTHQKAHAILQQRRFCIKPNDGFMAQLREYEPIYRAQKSVTNGQQRSKRTLYMIDGEPYEQNEHIDAMDS